MAKIMHQNELRAKNQKAKNDFEKDFLKLMNNSSFGKTTENVKIILVTTELATTEKRRNYLVSQLNYHSTKLFTETLLAIEMRKTQIFISITVYLGPSILELSKI